MTSIKEDKVLDVRDQLCPMPVVKAGLEMKTLEPGQVLKIVATDRGSIADVPAWAEDSGNELLHWHEDQGVLVFYVRRSEDAES